MLSARSEGERIPIIESTAAMREGIFWALSRNSRWRKVFVGRVGMDLWEELRLNGGNMLSWRELPTNFDTENK